MDIVEFLKETVPKRDKVKQLIAHTGLSPPAFVAAVTAGAAAIAAITCYFTSTSCCAAKDRDTKIQADGANDTGCKENQTPGCCSECTNKETEEAANSEANRDESILVVDEAVRAQEIVAGIRESDYMQADADEMATPVETPKEF